MTALIAVYNSGGCVGRCDAKCYNATGGDCDCICGGMNHGSGLDQAADNTRAHAEQWLSDYYQEKGLASGKMRSHINPDLFQEQTALFDISNFSNHV